jgi:PmbA protein
MLSGHRELESKKERLSGTLRAAGRVADQAEVFLLSSPRSVGIQFEANELKQVQTKESSSIALRIFREGRVGFATASGGVESENLVDMAVESSLFGSPANFEFPPLQGYSEVSVFDPTVEEIDMEQMAGMGKELIGRVRDHTSGVLCDVEVARGTSSVSVINSRGGEGRYDKSFFSLSLEGILVQDTDMLFVGDSESSCSPDFVAVDDLAQRVIRQLEMARTKATVPARTLPVVFTPLGVAGVLMTPIILAFSGKTVLEGASPLKGRLGEQVFDKRLSLRDDATVAYGLGSYPFDDEGVPGQSLPLIANGVAANFFYDLQTAAQAGTRSTGNGRRAGGSYPGPAISSLVLSGGDVSFEAMVEDMKEGLIVEQVIGAEQGNTLSGDFGGNVLLGYKVENGEIVGRVKDTMIAGNVYQVLGELLGIGREVRWVGGVLQAPCLYCPRVSVTTKGN